MVPPSFEQGAAIIKQHAKTLPETPGVYRMLDAAGEVLYVGKAKALKRRVTSYTQINSLSRRIQQMVSQTKDMLFVHTHTEAEALLLETNLIKKYKPYFNVLMRDDKSFPYILLTGNHDFPLLTKHRGKQKKQGDFFGPFANVSAVNRTITALQKAFLLRNCSDNVFSSRSRPCLQYQIKRCTAPCVGKVSVVEYAEQVKAAKDFLSGQSRAVQDKLLEKMMSASAAQEYEEAARFRDRIKALTNIQSKQDISMPSVQEADIFGLYLTPDGKSCIQVFFFRGGQNYGNRAYFPKHSAEESACEIMQAFIAQFYDSRPLPKEIILSEAPKNIALFEEAFNTRETQRRKVKITIPKAGDRKRLIEFVLNNAKNSLSQALLKQSTEKALLEEIKALFGLDESPKRIEVYDNSHISGTHMVGAMIVAGVGGFQKNAYRKFNIKKAKKSDDYGMMKEVMERRFGRALREGKSPADADWPDIVLIDGGKGQLEVTHGILQELGIEDDVTLVSIAKGEDRNAGREKFFIKGRDMFQLPINDARLHYLQTLRDEAHRFAIGSHRTRRIAAIKASPLDAIAGVGAAKKKALLHHFGSAEAVSAAAITDLKKVSGISDKIAEQIYNHFHDL